MGILSQNSLLRVDLRGEVIEMYKDPMVLKVFYCTQCVKILRQLSSFPP